MSDRTLPHNLEAEKCVLGAILINNTVFNQAAEVIDAQDFFRDAHRRLFEKMVALTDRSEPVDLVTLKDELTRSGELDEVAIYDSILDRSTLERHLKAVVGARAEPQGARPPVLDWSGKAVGGTGRINNL